MITWIHLHVFIGMFALMSNWVTSYKADPFKANNEMQKAIEEIEDENIREYVSNFFNNLNGNIARVKMFIFLMCFTPILNVCVLFSGFKDMKNNMKKL